MKSPLTLAAAAALLLSPAARLDAAANVFGQVLPGTTSFGGGGGTGFDNDGDGIVDGIDDQGNNVFDDLVDPNDPTGGGGGFFEAWDSPEVWVDYEADFNVIVGDTRDGTLELNGTTALRYRHLIVGGGLGDAAFTTDAGNDDAFNDFAQQLSIAGAGGQAFGGGNGTMIISGLGTVYNNDPYQIEENFVLALNEAGFAGAADGLTPDPSSRDRDIGYDAHIGFTGDGTLRVEAGGRMEIEDVLTVGFAGNGIVEVTGLGSRIIAAGKGDQGTAPQGQGFRGAMEAPSMIGGGGVGELYISDAASVSLNNGATIGWALIGLGPGLTNEGGTGVVSVVGAGSRLVVSPSAVLDLADLDPDTPNRVALAVGQLVAPGASAAGSATLEIGVGARVLVAPNTSYDTVMTGDASVGIGESGLVQMHGGSMVVSNDVFNTGDIRGNGLVEAARFRNELGAFVEGVGETFDTAAVQQRSVGPLRMVLSDTQPDAFTNLGYVEGLIDFNIAGGFENGDPNGVRGTGGADIVNGGTIRADGQIVAGSFYNRRFGQVVVGPGERLAILSDGAATLQDGDLGEDGGMTSDADGEIDTLGPVNFYQANLGAISINGGTLELGRLNPDGFAAAETMHVDLFRNARNYEPATATAPADEVIGTITSQDGELVFRDGVYNTGVMAFTAGDNLVRGEVLNANQIDYDEGTGVAEVFFRPGVILVSGDQTTVTFEDTVENNGVISIGPDGNVANFLGDLTGSGSFAITSSFNNDSAAIVVAGDVQVVAGSVVVNAVTTAPVATGTSVVLLSADGDLSGETQFTNFELPELAPGQFWDVIYDTIEDQVRLEVIESMAIGADFSGDGIVDGIDVDVWLANVGIQSGASIIQGDADGDGDVDLADYLVLMEQVYTGVPVSVPAALSAVTVPEPASLLLALAASLGLARPRRCR